MLLDTIMSASEQQLEDTTTRLKVSCSQRNAKDIAIRKVAQNPPPEDNKIGSTDEEEQFDEDTLGVNDSRTSKRKLFHLSVLRKQTRRKAKALLTTEQLVCSCFLCTLPD